MVSLLPGNYKNVAKSQAKSYWEHSRSNFPIVCVLHVVQVRVWLEVCMLHKSLRTWSSKHHSTTSGNEFVCKVVASIGPETVASCSDCCRAFLIVSLRSWSTFRLSHFGRGQVCSVVVQAASSSCRVIRCVEV